MPSLHRAAAETINYSRRAGLTIALVGNEKGGCGKSSTCMNVALGYKLLGMRVLIIDGDVEQRTITKWPRPPWVDNPAIVKCEPASILSTLAERIREIDVVLIDLPGREVMALADLLEVVDLLISPTKPSHLDMLELGCYIDVARAKGVPHVVVMNEATRETSEEISGLQQRFAEYGPYLPTAMQQLADYRRSYAFGSGVLELKRDLPAKLNFWKVFLQIRKLVDRAHDNWVASNGRR
jgi:chromosome partitioning protein